ncbi:hypothetical protein SAMN05428965_4091 [Geodermatophilus sp. DSM 45219]|nr:hypothetical protein SAMN05428965_4091 [Geodermatophilus sp. DSM 45219]
MTGLRPITSGMSVREAVLLATEVDVPHAGRP